MKFSPLILATLAAQSAAFSIYSPRNKVLAAVSKSTLQAIAPSKITDDDILTPDTTSDEPDLIEPEDVPGLNYDEDAIPIPHQPWRRGDTDGCEDPIDAPWRLEAEEIIKLAATGVGVDVRDITWYMASVVVTL